MASIGYRLSVKNVLLSQGPWPDNEVLSLFRERDRADTPEHPGMYMYQCPIGQLCDRLDVMGFRLTDTQNSMRRFVQELISMKRRYPRVCDPAEQHRRTVTENAEIDLLNSSTFERWRDTYIGLTSEWHRLGHLDTLQRGQLDQYLYAFVSDEPDAPLAGIRSPFGNVRSTLRAMLSSFGGEGEVCLDCSRLITDGWIDRSVKLTEEAIEQLLAPARAMEPIVVLTEGSSDTRLLSGSLERLFPHLRDFYVFLDHEGFSPQAGTGSIVNLLKGLAAARIANRVIAVFDNDSAGTVAVHAARKQGYPGNFRILQLPNLMRGRCYPTVGPSGPVDMDINGKACSLELYLGNVALTDESGALMPILWTGYEKKLRQYQGELSSKQKAQERYLELLENYNIGSNDPEFDDMRTVLRAIMNAFASSLND